MAEGQILTAIHFVVILHVVSPRIELGSNL